MDRRGGQDRRQSRSETSPTAGEPEGPGAAIFFDSPGGSIDGSIALGRLIHQQKLTVSVGRTIPLGCDRDKPLAELCVALKRSGHEVEAKLDPTIAMCYSACVFALAGGDVRLIPPGVRIAIHDMWFDPSHLSFALGRETEADLRREAYGRLRYYLREVGVDESLLTAQIAVPSDSLKELRREEIVRFGLDRREFDETAWQFVDKPAPSIRKKFFVRTDSEQTSYVDGLVRMGCGFDLSMHVVLARQYLAVRNFYVRTTYVPMKTFDAVADTAAIVVPGTELGRKDDVTLNMDGFSAAHAKLQKICAEAGRISQ